MKRSRILSSFLALSMILFLLSGCGGSASPSGTGPAGSAPPAQTSAPDTTPPPAEGRSIKIGLVNPTTGKLAGFGEGCPWTENLIVDYVNKTLGGIEIDGAKLPVELIMYDSTSDTTVCAEMAQKLCEEDKVDIIIARHTPETVNPVSAMAERYGVPCVAIEAPVDAVAGAGPYKVTCHSFWTLETMYEQYSALWEKAGYGPGKGYKIGIAFANDADGTAWYNVFVDKIKADGYELVDPGQYPDSTTDFTDVIKTFMDADIDILCGTNTNPNFADLWNQATAAGLDPAVVTMGKAYLLQSDAEAIGKKIMDGCMAEVWWSPTHPFVSELTGMTCAQLADLYKAETGNDITQPMGYKYASMEIVIDALMRAGSLKPDAIAKAIAETDLNTIVGPIRYDNEYIINGQTYLRYANTALAGGQWQYDAATDKLNLVIIDNSLYPDVPTTGAYRAR